MVHADQLAIDADLAAGLIHDQFAQWRGLAVRAVASAGTVNALFRIGDHLVARFPLRADAPTAVAAWLRREAGAAAELAGATSVLTPVPVAIGEPGAGYPLPWSVQTWLPGRVAWDAPATDALARDLAGFVRELRTLPTRGRRFSGGGRGGDLTAHDDWVEQCFERSTHLVDVPRLRDLWRRWRELPRGAEVMAHTDLIPGNVLLDDAGRLAGVIDVGGFGPADPALDLVAAWTLFDDGPRAVFAAGVATGDPAADELNWRRGRAWALQQAMGLVWYYERTNPSMHRLGMTIIRRLLG